MSNTPEPHFRPQPFWMQLWDLTLIQLSNWRWSWRGMLLTSVVTPMLGMVALGLFARSSGTRALEYVLTGNLVLGLVFGTLNKVCGNFTFMRARGMLPYFASLPIHSGSLVLATVTAFFLLTLPSVGITLGFGLLYLGLPLHPSPLVVIVLPLAAASLSAIGALIATRMRTPEEADALSMLVSLLLMGIGPVIVPPERLPGWLLILGAFSPATYAASALRQTLLGPLTLRLGLDLGVMTLFALVSLGLVGRWLRWRQSPD